jgi:hypothetical protein
VEQFSATYISGDIMKKFLFMFFIVTAMASGAHAMSRLFTATTSTQVPLSTYDDCTHYSYYGKAAWDDAEEIAIEQCRENAYVDCVTVGGRVFAVTSQEFVGWKSCHASVTVRGWR